MGEITTYKDLHAWQVGMDAVTLTYEMTSSFPPAERYGIVSQMRRAAVSIPSNVAEGHGVKQGRWALRHVSTAIGSALELETQLEASVRLKYLTRDQALPLFETLDRAQKLLYGMRRRKMADLGISAGAGALLFCLIRIFS